MRSWLGWLLVTECLREIALLDGDCRFLRTVYYAQVMMRTGNTCFSIAPLAIRFGCSLLLGCILLLHRGLMKCWDGWKIHQETRMWSWLLDSFTKLYCIWFGKRETSVFTQLKVLFKAKKSPSLSFKHQIEEPKRVNKKKRIKNYKQKKQKVEILAQIGITLVYRKSHFSLSKMRVCYEREGLVSNPVFGFGYS